MVYAVILAGGSGTRLGADKPKQFLEIGSRPVIIRSIDAFLSSGFVDSIIVSVPEIYTGYMRELNHKFYPDVEITVVSGGANRNSSLLNALEYIKNNCNYDKKTVVLTHDAVRPFINSRIIADNIAAAREFGGCNTVVKCVDTVLVSEDGKFIHSVPDRRTLYNAQTPQSFLFERLYTVYSHLSDDEKENMTDACSVFIKYGRQVALVKGDEDNIKITYKGDLDRAETIINKKTEDK